MALDEWEEEGILTRDAFLFRREKNISEVPAVDQILGYLISTVLSTQLYHNP